MSRNFGAKTRDMSRAGKVFAQKNTNSFDGQNTLSQRFNQFVKFIKEKYNFYRLEEVTKETVKDYAEYLEKSDLSASTKQDYLSAVNVIMKEARGDDQVRVTGREANLEKRSNVAKVYKGNAGDRGKLSDRTQHILELARAFGLRFEEASKIDARSALIQSEKTGVINIYSGTKGGQAREIPITSKRQIEALTKASNFQNKDRSMIAIEKSYKQHKTSLYKETSKFHAERHAYANERYSILMKEYIKIDIKSPVLSDKKEGERWSYYIAKIAFNQGVNLTPESARDFDRKVRLQISKELGHHREDVVSQYIGGQK
jgi:site-specific recombinase XerD